VFTGGPGFDPQYHKENFFKCRKAKKLKTDKSDYIKIRNFIYKRDHIHYEKKRKKGKKVFGTLITDNS
jgi:hypothetical protein